MKPVNSKIRHSLSFLFAVSILFPAQAQMNLSPAAGPGGLPAEPVARFPAQDRNLPLNDALRENQIAPAQTMKNFSQIGTGTGPAESPASPRKNAVESTDSAYDLFQRFVHKNTGKDLPLYGYNLFEDRRYEPFSNLPVPGQYVVGPGDDIDLKIWGSSDLTVRLTVDRDGHINIPKIGPVMVAGTRTDQLEALLKSRVGKVLNNFELSASLGRLKAIQIYVVGHARRPGMYTVSGLSTLVNALFESGGPSATGSMRRIQLIRQGKTISILDMYPFIQNGHAEGDVALLNGDVLVIPAAGPRSALVGAVELPAVYELKSEGESLRDLLHYAGGLKVLASPHRALVERISPSQTQAPRSVIEIALGDKGSDTIIHDGDLVTLEPIHPQFSNAITLRGNVAYPSRYTHTPGMRVADLVSDNHQLIKFDYFDRKNALVRYEQGQEGKKKKDSFDLVDRIKGNSDPENRLYEVKNLIDEINWSYAVLERLDARSLKPLLIPFNLRLAVHEKDPAHNLLLQPGDVVTVFGVKDLPVPLEERTQFVRLAGEVKVPGVYQLQPKETLATLIRRAGGLTSNAYAYGTELLSESARRQQQDNLERAIRRMEVSLSGQFSAQAQNASDAEKLNVQTQMAMQKSMLERLKQMKSTGRIALELTPNSTEFPSLTLEDGDSVVVPHRSDFVAVFGAVMLETSLFHRPGSTVRDYLEKAGPTREADLDGALLIKADGTLVANRAQRSWIGWGHSNFMSTSVYPGDTIFVPELIDRRTPYVQLIQGAKDWTQLLYQFGLGAVAIKTLRN